MADGSFRFHQPGTGPFYPSQHNNHRNHNRTVSPHGPRRPFNNDTPSPSRSPVNPSIGHNFNMYTHNGYQNQHNMMNGGQNHQRYGNLHMQKYQQGHHNHHNQVNQHHQQHAHGGHVGHQHTISSGNFQSSTPHLTNYGHDSLQNGNGDGLHHDENEEMENEHWREQKQYYEESKELSGPNQRARTVAHHSKGLNYVPMGSAAEDLPVAGRAGAVVGQIAGKQNWDELDLGGQGLNAISPILFFAYTFIKRLDLNFNRLTSLPPAIGTMKNLEHLDLSGNQLTDLPEEIGMLTNLRHLNLFDNHIQTLCYELGYLYKLEVLGIMGNPIEPGQKDKLLEGGTKALITYLRESMPEPPPPREREWHQLDEYAPNDKQVDTLKALTYNILCERAATPQMYGYVPERVLGWSFRKTLILDEIREIDADVVCLQELDRASYDDFFRGQLSMSGYRSYYAQRSRAETLGENAKYVDGCGTFWKDKKYVLLDTQVLVLGRKAVERPGAKASADMLNRVWQKDNIATVTFLENRATGSRVIVANSHMLWDPAFKDVKLIQAAVLMEELTKLAERYAKHPPATNKQVFRFSDAGDDSASEPLPEPGPSLEYASGTQIPMIICGDFNSGLDSAVYNLMTKKGMDADHEDLDGRDYGSFSRGGMSHSFTLKSSYHAIESEMPFTNYTPAFVDILDYIWYSNTSLRVTGLLGEVDPDYLRRVPGFPNFHFPSDHLALVSEFRFEKQRGAQKIVEADFGSSSRK